MGTILIVEDDEQNHILMDSVIQSMGHDAIHARNGQEALELADQYHPDLILLDIRLPIVNGLKVASILKGDAQLGHIPIVAVSVQVEGADEQKALNAGCDAFISKPFTLSIIRECINHFVG